MAPLRMGGVAEAGAADAGQVDAPAEALEEMFEQMFDDLEHMGLEEFAGADEEGEEGYEGEEQEDQGADEGHEHGDAADDLDSAGARELDELEFVEGGGAHGVVEHGGSSSSGDPPIAPPPAPPPLDDPPGRLEMTPLGYVSLDGTVIGRVTEWNGSWFAHCNLHPRCRKAKSNGYCSKIYMAKWIAKGKHIDRKAPKHEREALQREHAKAWKEPATYE